MNKTLSIIFIGLLILFGVFFTIISILTVIFIPIELANHSLDSTAKGFNNFIQILNPYTSIITLSITIFAIYLAIRQLRIAEDANLIPKRTEWTSAIKTEILGDSTELTLNNFFVDNLEDIFNWIYKQNTKMTIDKEIQLNSFYKKFISRKIIDLIENSTEYQNNRDTTLNINYTLQTANRIIRIILKPTINYSNLYRDFEAKYLADINRFRAPL